MPVYIRPREVVAADRATNDSKYYYDYFFELLKDQYDEEQTSEFKIQQIRLKKWVDKYKSYAYKYHIDNFIPADDLYENPAHAKRFTYGIKIPRAPFIEVFGDIPDGNN